MTSYDYKKVRPKDGWALLLADKREAKTAGGLILTEQETGIEKVTELSGELIRLGGGEYVEKMRELGVIKEGDRVVFRGFLKYANPLPTDESWETGEKKEFFFIDCKDILGVVGDGAKVGVYSGRPATPHVQPTKE